MLPTRILHSCGNSSRLLLRKKPPIGVRCDLESASKCMDKTGVPTRMLRNLGILNSFLCRPTRSNQYRANPAEASRTSGTTGTTKTTKTTADTKANKRSNIYFKLVALLPLFSSLYPATAAVSSPVRAGYLIYPPAKTRTSAAPHPTCPP